MPNVVSNCEEKFNIDEYDFEESYYTFEEQKCLQLFYETVHEILVSYSDILMQIFGHLYYCPTSYSLGRNKFEEVRKHLFEFLYSHKDFFKFDALIFKIDNLNNSKKVRFYYLDDASKLIDFNNFLRVVRKEIKPFSDTKVQYSKKEYSVKLKINNWTAKMFRCKKAILCKLK